jgi:hypothetical protein
MTTFLAAAAFVALAMAGLGLGVILRGRSIKGHCGGKSCNSITTTECESPELSVSNCRRTIHLPGQ